MTRYLAIAYLTSGVLAAGPSLGMTFFTACAWAFSVLMFALVITRPAAR